MQAPPTEPVMPNPTSPHKELPEINPSVETVNNEGVSSVGITAWRNLFGGWLVLFCVFGYINSFGVYQDYYTRSHFMSASSASWIGSTELFLTTSLGLISGRLLDKGYFRVEVLAGSILYVFSLFMLSLADPQHYYQVFLSQGLGMGIGAGFVYIPSIAVQSHHWGHLRPLAMGIEFTGTSCGGIVFPIMINRLLAHGVSFAWAVRATAFVVAVLLALANVMLTPVDELRKGNQNKYPSLRTLSKDIPYVLVTTGSFCCLWGVFYPYFYVQLYSTTHGIDPVVAFYTVAVVNASSIPGRVVLALFVERFGCFNLLIACGIGTAAIVFGLYGIQTLPGVLIFSILSGFLSGGWFALVASAMASFTQDPGEIGFRLGVAFALSNIGSLTGTPIEGALLGPGYAWSRTIIFSGVNLVAGTIIIAISREWVVRQKKSQWV